MALIALTGGIGSGKSVVAEMLGVLGYDVYDCDSRAKYIMDESEAIKKRIRNEICRAAVDESGVIDRKLLAEEVFGSEIKLNLLNSMVHDAVKADLMDWYVFRDIAFVETAILYQSSLDRVVDAVWNVTASRDLRIERVMKRSGMTPRQVEDSIAAQDSYCDYEPHPHIFDIVNDGVTPVLPRVLELLSYQ